MPVTVLVAVGFVFRVGFAEIVMWVEMLFVTRATTVTVAVRNLRSMSFRT
jgi:hypothetical protein